MLAVAKGYRERHLPLDVLVLDWFYYTKMGEFDLRPDSCPDPGGHEPTTARHGHSNHDQCVAALHQGFSLSMTPF